MPSPAAGEAATAFDALAPTYDHDFTASPLAQALRARVHRRLLRLLPPGGAVLDLGCGTGEDARFLAQQGAAVTAADSSAAMRQAAADKLDAFSSARVVPLDLNALPPAALPGPYPLVYANFGVLNCVHDLRALADWLAARIPTGGRAAFAVMGPFCLWESTWHGLHGAGETARRRWHGPAAFRTADGELSVRYPSPGTVTAAFAPAFRRVRLRPLGAFIPPSDIFPVIERRPWLQRPLIALDRVSAAFVPLAWISDHYWIELARG